jgi:hypothetical protein
LRCDRLALIAFASAKLAAVSSRGLVVFGFAGFAALVYCHRRQGQNWVEQRNRPDTAKCFSDGTSPRPAS